MHGRTIAYRAFRAAVGGSAAPRLMLEAEQSTSAIIVHHPEAKYFNAR